MKLVLSIYVLRLPLSIVAAWALFEVSICLIWDIEDCIGNKMNTLKKKPTIFLADLVHDKYIYNYCVPLNIGYIAARVLDEFKDDVDLRLFKFPTELVEALKDKPDIIGLSNYDWNINLNQTIIEIARRYNPDVFIVMGGPNIRGGDDGAREFLTRYSKIDAYIVYEGEDAFANVVRHLVGHEGTLRENLIKNEVVLPQLAYLTPGNQKFVIGGLCESISAKHIPHPSAWLSGVLDPFLNNEAYPLSPIIETTRGCPYSCTYCTAWGTNATGIKTVRLFDMDVVFDELEYVFKNSEHEFYLIIGDANIGILPRDLEVAERIRYMSEKYGKVTQVGIDTSKNSLDRNIEIYNILGGLSIPTFAQQTFNDAVSVNIGRKNVTFGETKNMVDKVHENGSSISTDLLIGLPGESKDEHITSTKMAYDAGFDRFQIADIRLLLGTDMETDESREKWGLKTKVRIIPNSFGIYEDQKVLEYEVCIRETAAMSEADFLNLRLFHAHIFIILNLEIGRPHMDYAETIGIHPIDLAALVSEMPSKDQYPKLFKYLESYISQATSEWFDSQEEADNYYKDPAQWQNLLDNGFPKLNYDYASSLIADAELLDEFLTWIEEAIIATSAIADESTLKEISQFTKSRLMAWPFEKDIDAITVQGSTLLHLRRYIEGFSLKDVVESENYRLSFAIEDHNYNTIIRSVGTDTVDRHLLQLSLQYHNKFFLRDVGYELSEYVGAYGTN